MVERPDRTYEIAEDPTRTCVSYEFGVIEQLEFAAAYTTAMKTQHARNNQESWKPRPYRQLPQLDIANLDDQGDQCVIGPRRHISYAPNATPLCHHLRPLLALNHLLDRHAPYPAPA